MNKHRDCSNRLAYDFDKISSKDYHKITKSVVKEFKLIPHTELINGLDETFQDFILNQSIIGLEWDIWSGYIVNAKNPEAELLVEKIAKYISVLNT
ncbi:hypothetical protein JK628_10725 [Shewanella sp. KX20019]|uniref:hypothetical protein n=1 Tax=Shewanella sp. KX20019 TaxID=2803864 RepID=UPI001926CEBD|nr:hypothetical protein [Shewanella sp. KX20019]QQX82235.1 hypothetical protein JK628_10725 [Shewanella sp. KX20019]